MIIGIAAFLVLTLAYLGMPGRYNRALFALAFGMMFSVPVFAQETLRTIVFMTDFGVQDDAVGLCRGVMNGIAPGVRIFDITHQVTPFDIAQGARYLGGSSPYFPKDAVFVVIVDPGVGSTRKAIIAKSRVGQFLRVAGQRAADTDR